MRILVDTSVWSLAFRRRARRLANDVAIVEQLTELIDDGRAVMAGCIRQEILSGIASSEQFARLVSALSPFDDLAADRTTHELAAELFNRCRAKGVQGSHIDFLICALSLRHATPIFTTDADFKRYAPLCNVTLLAASAASLEA